MKERKTIIYIIPSFPCYSEVFILNELCEIKKRGLKTVILALRKPREEIIQSQAEELMGDVLYCPFVLSLKVWVSQLYFLFKKPGSYLGVLLQIIAAAFKKPQTLLKNMGIFPKSVCFAFLCRNICVSHIQAHFANFPATSAMVVSRLLGVPFTFTCHAHDIFYDQTLLDLKIRQAKECFAVSRYNRDYILALFPYLPEEKIKVIHCGIDISRFAFKERDKSGGKVKIMSAGRLMPTKGFEDLLMACGLLKERGLDFSCDIVGGGPLEKKLINLSRSLGLERCIRFHGALRQERLIDLYYGCDVFVLAAKKAKNRDVQDGIPVVLMEAMATGLPVISTRISGVPELIEDGESGILVKPQDYRAIADAVMFVANNNPSAKGMALAARNKVCAEFDISKTVNQLLREYGHE